MSLEPKTLDWNRFRTKLKGCNFSVDELSKLYESYGVGKIRESDLNNCDILYSKLKKLPSLRSTATDILLKMAKTLKINDVISLCKTSKDFNKFICKNTYFWKEKLEQDFGKNSLVGVKIFEKEYMKKYKMMLEYKKKHEAPPSWIRVDLEKMAHELHFTWVWADEFKIFKLTALDLEYVRNGATIYIFETDPYTKLRELNKHSLKKKNSHKKLIDYIQGELDCFHCDPWIVYRPGLFDVMKKYHSRTPH